MNLMRSSDPKLSILSTVELAIELPPNDATGNKVTLRVSEIDSLIVRLAQLRATMTPAIPTVLSESTTVAKVVNPSWVLHAPAGVNDKILAVRHPGLGWIMAHLPSLEAARLGHALLSGGPRPFAGEDLSSTRLH
jgi:hypothetical protein